MRGRQTAQFAINQCEVRRGKLAAGGVLGQVLSPRGLLRAWTPTRGVEASQSNLITLGDLPVVAFGDSERTVTYTKRRSPVPDEVVAREELRHSPPAHRRRSPDEVGGI